MVIDNPLDEARVRYKIRRGMLELDLLLKQFVDDHYATLDTPQQVIFNQLLELEDPQLYSYFFATASPPTKELVVMVELVRNATIVQ